MVSPITVDKTWRCPLKFSKRCPASSRCFIVIDFPKDPLSWLPVAHSLHDKEGP